MNMNQELPKVGMVKQAKSLSKETFWVKTAPFSSRARSGLCNISGCQAGPGQLH